MRIRYLLALAIAATALTGCTGLATPAGTAAPAPVVTPAAPSNQDLAEYFSAVAAVDPQALLDVAGRLAAPGSNAYAYAIEQAGAAQASIDGGYPFDGSKITTTADGFSVCYTDALSQEKTCSDFTNLEYVDGRLSDFDAGGTPLAGRIVLGSNDPIALGDAASVRLIAAYRTISGSVNVVLEVKSNVDGLTLGYGSSYLAPDGRQASSSGVSGPNSLQAGSLANFLIAFDGAVFGGTLHLVGHDSAFNEVSADIAITPSK